MPPIFAAIADDDTGATDLAGMLTGQGMRTIVVLEGATPSQIRGWSAECDAVVLTTASRAIPPEEASERTTRAAEALKALHPLSVAVKYCSTFDSTPEGNIGQSVDAAMDVFDEPFTVALPALPILGRTTYLGHHFVHRELLSDSPMRNHPIHPMTNSNLVSHLQKQTRRKVGLAPYAAVAAGAESLRHCLGELQETGIGIAILDCVSEAHLTIICRAISGMRLITGSSAPGIYLPAIWREMGKWSPPAGDTGPTRRKGSGGGFLVVSGSCSPATLLQNRFFESQGALSFALDGVAFAAGAADGEQAMRQAVAAIKAGRNYLLKTSNGARDVEAVHRWARENGMPAMEAGRKISAGTAAIVRGIVSQVQPQGIILAGGETSGVVSRALGFRSFRVGRNIEPGVPVCVPLTAPWIPLVLKSGNFGGEDFYLRAIAAIEALPVTADL